MVLPVTFKPEAMFRIKPVTRASSTLEGHSEAVLNVSFSPNGRMLASASGDTTVRMWDLNTECPDATLEGHKGWVLYVAFSPDGKILASAGMDKNVLLWDVDTGKQRGLPLKGHKNFITRLEISHRNMHNPLFGTNQRQNFIIRIKINLKIFFIPH